MNLSDSGMIPAGRDVDRCHCLYIAVVSLVSRLPVPFQGSLKESGSSALISDTKPSAR